MQRNYHVTRRPDGNWQFKLPHADRASGITRTQAEATLLAKTLARNGGDGGEITIHRPNGVIRDKDTISPAHDPRDIKG